MLTNLFQLLEIQNYSFGFLSFRFMAVGALCTFLGVFILFRERGSAAGKVYFVFALTLAFWMVGEAMSFTSPNATSVFLKKPFRRTQLVDKVESLLNTDSPEA